MRRLLVVLFACSFGLSLACASAPEDDPSGSGGSGGEGGTGGAGGEGGGGGVGGTGGLPESITVEGWVSWNGKPMEDVVVVLDYDSERHVTTAQDGRFRFEDVVPPYDLAVLAPGRDSERALYGYHGLTHENPRVPVAAEIRYADLSGSITGVERPNDKTSLLLALSGVDASFVYPSYRVTDQIGFERMHWRGDATYSGTMVGVEVDTADANGFRFTTAGVSDPFEVSDQGSAEVHLVMDKPVETQPTQIVRKPGAFTAHGRVDVASLEIFGAVFRESEDFRIVGTEIELPTEGAAIRFTAYDADESMGMVVVPAVLGGETILELPDEMPLVVVGPERRAVVSSLLPTLEWTEVPGARSYDVFLKGPNLEASWIVPAGTTRLQVPSLPSLGFQLDPKAAYRWEVRVQIGARSTPQELADPDGPGAHPPSGRLTTPLTSFSMTARFDTPPVK